MGRLNDGPTLPHLDTARLSLVPVGPEHLDDLVELNSDPAVMRYLLPRPATSDETRLEWADRLGARSDPARGLGYWAGFERTRDGSTFVGWWSASSFVTDATQAGLGYRLRRTAWGRGLATEGARAMLAQAFACPEVERVVASTMAVNEPSRAVLSRLGMTQVDAWVGTWDDPVDGWEQGEVGYAVTRADWDGLEA